MSQKEILAKIKELQIELERRQGKRGICTQCGEEKPYSNAYDWVNFREENWGQDKKPKLCRNCYNEKRTTEMKKHFEHLIGLKVEEILVDPTDSWGSLQGVKLEGGYIIEVEREYDEPDHLIVRSEV